MLCRNSLSICSLFFPVQKAREQQRERSASDWLPNLPSHSPFHSAEKSSPLTDPWAFSNTCSSVSATERMAALAFFTFFFLAMYAS